MKEKLLRSMKLALMALLGTMFVVAARAQTPLRGDERAPSLMKQLDQAARCESAAQEKISRLRHEGIPLEKYFSSLPRASEINLDLLRNAETNPAGLAHNKILWETARLIIDANQTVEKVSDGPCKIGLDLGACTIREKADAPGQYTADFRKCRIRVIYPLAAGAVFGPSEI